MKCQILFSRKNKKSFTKLSSAESAHSMVSVKQDEQEGTDSGTFQARPIYTILCVAPILTSNHVITCRKQSYQKTWNTSNILSNERDLLAEIGQAALTELTQATTVCVFFF